MKTLVQKFDCTKIVQIFEKSKILCTKNKKNSTHLTKQFELYLLNTDSCTERTSGI